MGYWANFKKGWFSFVREVTSQADMPKTKMEKIVPISKNDISDPAKKLIKKAVSPPETKHVEEALPVEKEEYEAHIDPPQAIALKDDYVETPTERLERIRRVRKPKNHSMTGKRRQLLFLNPGTEKIQQCISAIKNGDIPPNWASNFTEELTLRNGTLYFENLPMFR